MARTSLLGEALVVLQDLEQLALRELRDDAELALRLERVHHGDDVIVLSPAQDFDLLAQDLMSFSVLPCLAMNFIAVICPVNFLRALYTFPKLPSPTSSMTW